MMHTGEDNKEKSNIEDERIQIKKTLELLLRNKWLILMSGLIFLAISALIVFSIPSQYQTTALLQIKPSLTKELNSSKAAMQENNIINIEQGLLKTRYILEPVIILKQLNLHTEPNYFPIIGKWIANHHHKNSINSPWFGLEKYAWGGEKLVLQKFSVDEKYLDKTFTLIAGINGSYDILSPSNQLLLRGTVGKEFDADTIKIKINRLDARPNTIFYIKSSSFLDKIEQLSNRLKIINISGSDSQTTIFSQPTGIFQLQLLGTDALDVVATLNSIIKIAVKKNAEQALKETLREIQSINIQLFKVKTSLEKSESNLKIYRKEVNPINMTTVSQLLITKLTSLEQELEKIKSERVDLLQNYTYKHPLLISSLQRENIINKQLSDIKRKMQTLTESTLEEDSLIRDIKIKNATYISLLNEKQKLEIAKLGFTPDINVLNYATKATKLPSNKLLKMIGGFIFGLWVACFLIIIKSLYTNKLNASSMLENLHIPIHGTIPVISHRDDHLPNQRVYADVYPQDYAINHLRDFYSMLSLNENFSEKKVIAVLGGSASSRKSFITENLSFIASQLGKKVLLIDGNFYEKNISYKFKSMHPYGLLDYIHQYCDYSELVDKIKNNLHLIHAGKNVLTPFIQRESVKNMLEDYKKQYDYIFLDTVDCFNYGEGFVMAKIVDFNLLVINSKEPVENIKLMLKKIVAYGIKIDSGLITN